jgi:hypothetical protein
VAGAKRSFKRALLDCLAKSDVSKRVGRTRYFRPQDPKLGTHTKVVVLTKTEPSKPWASFPMQVNVRVQSFFSMSIISEVGDGTNTCPGSKSVTLPLKLQPHDP